MLPRYLDHYARTARLWLVPLLAVLFAAVLLAGCAGLEKPRNLGDRIAYGYATVSSARLIAADLYTANRISKATAQKVQNSADKAREALDSAYEAWRGNRTTEAQSVMDTIKTVLSELRAFVAEGG